MKASAGSVQPSRAQRWLNKGEKLQLSSRVAAGWAAGKQAFLQLRAQGGMRDRKQGEHKGRRGAYKTDSS